MTLIEQLHAVAFDNGDVFVGCFVEARSSSPTGSESGSVLSQPSSSQKSAFSDDYAASSYSLSQSRRPLSSSSQIPAMMPSPQQKKYVDEYSPFTLTIAVYPKSMDAFQIPYIASVTLDPRIPTDYANQIAQTLIQQERSNQSDFQVRKDGNTYLVIVRNRTWQCKPVTDALAAKYILHHLYSLNTKLRVTADSKAATAASRTLDAALANGGENAHDVASEHDRKRAQPSKDVTSSTVSVFPGRKHRRVTKMDFA
jgi:hypothetical protein